MDFWEVAGDLMADSGIPDRVYAMNRLFVAITNDDDMKVKEMCLLDPSLVGKHLDKIKRRIYYSESQLC